MFTRWMRILRAVKLWMLIAAALVCWVLVGRADDLSNGYWLFTIVCWAVLDVYWAMAASDRKSAAAGNQSAAGYLAIASVYGLYCLPLSFVPLLGQRMMPRSNLLEALGALMCALGVALAIWARHVLAESWNAAASLRERHSLVQHGPYAVVRHPIYLGLLVAVAGMILVLGELRALVLVLGVDLLLRKMVEEDRILRTAFPGEYLDYERRVKRLLPWIW
jgi:protein-S-isoprenylcysteine O-methyltransferase Ste14